MRYTVDEALCAGHGQCFLTAPAVMHPDTDGFNRDTGRVIEVDEEWRSQLAAAARSCPEQAIHVVADARV